MHTACFYKLESSNISTCTLLFAFPCAWLHVMEVFTVGVDASYLDPSQTTTSKVELFGLSYAHCPPVQSSAVLLSTQINMRRVCMLGNMYEGIIVMA